MQCTPISEALACSLLFAQLPHGMLTKASPKPPGTRRNTRIARIYCSSCLYFLDVYTMLCQPLHVMLNEKGIISSVTASARLPTLPNLSNPRNPPPALPQRVYTKCAGSKKFATPSLTAYSCPQLPQTSFPSLIHVSSNTRCRSLAVWLGTSSADSAPSAAPAAPPSTRSDFSGTVGGSVGSPN